MSELKIGKPTSDNGTVDLSVLNEDSSEKPRVLLIDADIVAYRASATTDGKKYTVYYDSGEQVAPSVRYMTEAKSICERNKLDPKKAIVTTYDPEPEAFAINNVNKILQSLKDDLGTEEISLFLTPSLLFRNEYSSDYKKNREGLRRPANLAACKQYMMDNLGAIQIEGYEADDLLGITAMHLEAEDNVIPIICSLDKDLDMIPTYHYKWTKKELYRVTPEEGRLKFYKQLLTGDKVDNIPGLHRVGPKTAEGILEGCDGTDEAAMFHRVWKAYNKKIKCEEGESIRDKRNRVFRMITRNGRLLYILQRAGEVWSPPKGRWYIESKIYSENLTVGDTYGATVSRDNKTD